eukprot:608303-Prymnesium_polylepis.1
MAPRSPSSSSGSTSWRLLALLALAADCGSARRLAGLDHLAAPIAVRARYAERTPTAVMRSALLLRGGAGEEALPEPAEATTAESSDGSTADAPLDLAQDAKPEAEASLDLAASAPVGCWSVLSKLLSALRSFLSPTYDYAKKDTDILGDTSQKCGFAPDDETCEASRVTRATTHRAAHNSHAHATLHTCTRTRAARAHSASHAA